MKGTARRSWLAGVGLIAVLLIYPFNVTVTPEWKVKVVDENGTPVAGVYVAEFASYSRLDFQHNESMCTNLNGEAQFGRRTVRESLLARIFMRVSTFSIHGGQGPYVAVGVDRLGYGDFPTQDPMPNFNGLAWYGSPSRMSSVVTLHKCPRGFTGFKCSFDYHHFFPANSSAREIAACQSVSWQ